jgi:hypothetical protein
MAPPKKKTSAKKAASKTRAKKAVAKKAATRAPVARRADFGGPIDGFFTKQPEHLREVLETLRKLVMAAAPDATATLKWGMPFFAIGESMICAIAGHKAHVNLILPGAVGTFDDPKGLLVGEGKTGRHAKFLKLADVPTAIVRGWLETAVANAREGAKTGKRMR